MSAGAKRIFLIMANDSEGEAENLASTFKEQDLDVYLSDGKPQPIPPEGVAQPNSDGSILLTVDPKVAANRKKIWVQRENPDGSLSPYGHLMDDEGPEQSKANPQPQSSIEEDRDAIMELTIDPVKETQATPDKQNKKEETAINT